MHLAVLLGEATPGRDIEGEARENFRAPVSGVDWVLVIDNGDFNHEAPGENLKENSLP